MLARVFRRLFLTQPMRTPAQATVNIIMREVCASFVIAVCPCSRFACRRQGGPAQMRATSARQAAADRREDVVDGLCPAGSHQ